MIGLREVNDDQLIKLIAKCIGNFYGKITSSLDNLKLNSVLLRKNPYLFRMKAIQDASEIVDSLLSAYVSSSEETIFGNVFFEPIATFASGGNKALAEGIDVMMETEDTIYAIAVKSGTNVFNSSSRKKQEQNFNAAKKLADQIKKRYVPIIGYGYGKKTQSDKGIPKIYMELAGQEFWEELTGDDKFYLKLVNYMQDAPEKYIQSFRDAYTRALNRFVMKFTAEFCKKDGSIDWEKLVAYNSSKKVVSYSEDGEATDNNKSSKKGKKIKK
ncbi:MAG: cytoplasmic protein [Ruminiclostridium sp.]|nr:cytoplasmic protein [Ruminiclostridium sp.]